MEWNRETMKRELEALLTDAKGVPETLTGKDEFDPVMYGLRMKTFFRAAELWLQHYGDDEKQ